MKGCNIKGCKEIEHHIHEGKLILFFDGTNKNDYTKKR